MPKLVKLECRPAFLLAALVLGACASAPAAVAQGAAPATIAGRVTDGERGTPGVAVILISNEQGQRFRTAARAKTDAEGRFLLTNVAPGRYQIVPVAPASVVEGLGMSYPPGRPLTIVAGEEVKDIDFKMEPGCVVTGRITDADGNPVIGEVVNVQPVDNNVGPSRLSFDMRDQMTDDRGVYRIYGLLPGRYLVSVGRADETGAVSMGRRKIFRRTFYPDATEQAQARPVELKSGIEATDIDITVGRALKTYRVAGRFVTAEGQPAAGVAVGFITIDERGRRTGGYASGVTTNARGEFVTDGLAPGRYGVYATNSFLPQGATEFYSDAVLFEVTDADVSGVLVKVKRGATVSGVVSIEGVPDRAAIAQMLSALRIYSFVEPKPQQLGTPGNQRPINVNPDGTFTVTGLPPGKLRLGVLTDAVKGLTTTRVDLNGTSIISGFELAEGAQVTGVRIMTTYGSSTIVGQTTYLNGAPQPGARVMAFARLVTPTPGNVVNRSSEVDARGFFRIEGLPAGEYEVSVNVFFFGPTPGAHARRSEPVRIVVGDNSEAKVTPAIDFK